ncbi:hypothetical protein AYO44_01360 [Planctomycetaceae bacterium SCGC AG-212-F19]|nr:hypothetical protein AYO44_01360 [Planctomycetaceae bacterium SCGC AG-212-F19]
MAVGGLIRSTREQITDVLREEILCGRLDEGVRLSEAKLAERFGVSRGPIREALAQLTQEGLLVAKPNCGVKVAPSAPDAINDLIVPIRRAIETYALKLFFDELTDEDLGIWDDILHRLKRACLEKDVKGITLYDIAFHRAILVRAGQPDLLVIWQTMLGRIRKHFQASAIPYAKNYLAIYKQHQTIVDVFRGGDKAAAVRALEEHIC